MSEHRAAVEWRRNTDGFGYEDYNCEHTWRFEGDIEVPASSAPEYLGKPGSVDPEEAFVASASSCHMLTFLAIASRKRYIVDSYKDAAVGFMTPNADGKLWVSRIELRPEITFSGERLPSPEAVERIHERAHHECFIANSVRSEIVMEQFA